MGPDNGADLSDRIQWEGLFEQARRVTYRLIDRTDATGGGTAVAVKNARRFFLATARHVIDNDHRIKVLVRDSVIDTTSEFTNRVLHDEADVALLELEPSVAQHLEFTPETRIQPVLDMEAELPVIVLGYPGQFIRSGESLPLNDNTDFQVQGFNPFTCRSVTLPCSDWPGDDIDSPLVPERDLLVDFRPEPQLRRLGPRNIGMEAPAINGSPPHPHGLSGGGIWLAKVKVSEESGLQIPNAQLIGLQIGYRKLSGLLRGVRIGVWLDILPT